MRKSTVLLASAAVLLGLASIGVAWWDVWGGRRSAPPATGPGIAATAPAGGPFTMVDHAGRTVTDQTYRGEYLLVFFGYTHCPDVCPTTLDRITQVMEALGPDGEAVQPLFVSVDPRRDTPEVLAAHIGSFASGCKLVR
jgi:cytochrome oxidase Cu insertion factor (SCO1/SenC/PrrC family)